MSFLRSGVQCSFQVPCSPRRTVFSTLLNSIMTGLFEKKYVKFMCMYVHENMWPLTDTYIEDEREKWTTYNYRYFRSSGIQMISLDSDSFDKSVY